MVRMVEIGCLQFFQLVYVKVFFFRLIPGTEADARNDASCNQTFEQVLRIHLTAECNAAGVGVCNQLLVK